MKIGKIEKLGVKSAAYCIEFLAEDSGELIRYVHASGATEDEAIMHAKRRYACVYADTYGDTSQEVLELRAQVEAEGGLV